MHASVQADVETFFGEKSLAELEYLQSEVDEKVEKSQGTADQVFTS
jgi:hypothetical protein